MKLSGFYADADLVGRRARFGWSVALEGEETLADVPRIAVRRKVRDFEFPAPDEGEPDPFLVYDSRTFPAAGAPADRRVSELPVEERREGEERSVVVVESVTEPLGGERVEVLRRTITTVLGSDGAARRQRVDVLDTGRPPQGLTPRTTYYYELDSPLVEGAADRRPYRATATVHEIFGLDRTLYQALPAIFRRHDVTLRPPTAGAEAMPEAAPRSGQLRRFVDLFGAALDLLRGSAEGLGDLRDLERVDHRFLPHLASWIGWDLSFDTSIPVQRHEVRYAAALYRITGTLPGCMVWVRRLAGWDSRIKEFHKNVFRTNHVGDPDVPGDRGSRTVDTSDPALLAGRGKFEDDLDYTYDAGTGDEDWYSFNTVGIFVRPAPGESPAAVVRKRGRLAANLQIFLPVNVRGVVILEVEALDVVGGDRMDVAEPEP